MDNNRYSLLAEQILRIQSGGDSSDDSELELREIALLVGQVHASLVRVGYFENIKAEGAHGVNGQFKATFYKLPVLFQSDRQEHYCLLPKQYLSLPHGKGLDQVSEWGKEKPKPIMPVNTGFNTLARGLRSAGLEGHYGCYPEGSTVYFLNETERDFTPKFVNVRLVIADPSNVSADQELAIISEVTRLLAQRRPQDKQNDGNPTAI